MALNRILPQGPNIHCGDKEPHDKHANAVVPNAWCDGVPPLESFYELTIRVPLSCYGHADDSHQQALHLLNEEGLGFILDQATNTAALLALRVRAGGEDRFYPMFPNGTAGFKMVVDAPAPFGDVS
jgi:hypothetical protein